MSLTPSAVARTPPRFEPQLARRKLAGTLFLGACVGAIGLLLLALVILLYDIVVRGLPYLDPSSPARRRESRSRLASCRRWSGPSRS